MEEAQASGKESSEKSGEQQIVEAVVQSAPSILRRGIAYLIDLGILNGFIMWRTSAYEDSLSADRLALVVAILYVFAFLPAAEGFWRHGSPGKILLGLTVVGPDGRGISPGRSFARTALKFGFGVPTLFLAWGAALFGRRRRALHDLLAGSQVVRDHTLRA
jgi:uncharacterized RDD family membrane protein YckC